MTRIALIGDPHCASYSRHGGPKTNGINVRGQLTIKSLADALNMAHTHGAKLAIILGDLLDSMRPEPQLLAALRKLFRQLGAAGLEVWMLKGNHDSASDEKGDCALYALIEKTAAAVDVPTVLKHKDVPVCMVPFRSGVVAEWLPDTLAALKPPPGAILCLHAGIKDKETAPWLQSAPDAIEREVLSTLMDQYEFAACFAGNWHDHRVWSDYDIHQVGALTPTGFSNLGIEPYGHVAFYDTETHQDEGPKYMVVPGPRFLKLKPDEHPQALPDLGHAYFVEWHVAPEKLENAKTMLEAAIAAKRVFAGSVLPDGEGVREGLQEAAFAAKLAVGLDEAISAYVGGLKMPEHLRRESVEARVRSLLGS